MMNYQSIGRNQRSKGSKVQQAAFLLLLLIVFFWLLYQIRHSLDGQKDHCGSKLNILRQKGNGGDEDDDYMEEKAEEEFYKKKIENVAIHEGREDLKEPKTEYEELKTKEIGDGIGVVTLNKHMYKENSFNKRHENALSSVIDHDVQGDEKDPETIVKEPQNNEKDTNSTLIPNKDEAVKENDEDKVHTKMEEKIAVQPGAMVNATAPGQLEMEDGVHKFHDENGVPEDVNDVVESIRNEPSDDQNSTLSREGSITAHVELESKGTLEETQNDRMAD